jgi:hypothetical protein
VGAGAKRGGDRLKQALRVGVGSSTPLCFVLLLSSHCSVLAGCVDDGALD